MGRPIPYRIVDRRQVISQLATQTQQKLRKRSDGKQDLVLQKCVKMHGVGKASIQMDLKTKMVMSIIVPCLNEEEVLPLFYQALEALRQIWKQEIEYVFVR